MSQRSYQIDEEIEIEFKVKVKFNQIMDYQYLNDEEIKNIVQDAKEKIKNHLMFEILDEYVVDENLTHMCDLISYSVEEIKE
jgi:hypothetical protein